ncbi:MAG: hypothetical protein DCF16_02775 [Alphaproteobacteria bacterium]|nr:MAG: hypothetical protein DCF16_02775 [Alphaproteobacteria bacterium]
MRALVLTLLVALGACATQLPQVVTRDGGVFDIRYDNRLQTTQEADLRADRHCGGPAAFETEQTGFDGLSYRTYRCRER